MKILQIFMVFFFRFRSLAVDMPKHSQIQLQILSLYKQFLKLSKHKPGLREVIRHEFRKNASTPRTDILRVEYQYRLGKKQLENLKNSEVDSVGVFEREK